MRDRSRRKRDRVGGWSVVRSASARKKTSEFLGCEARARRAPSCASRNDDDRRDAGRSAAERRATAAGEGRARDATRAVVADHFGALGTPRRSRPAVARLLRVASPVADTETIARSRPPRVCSRGRPRRRERGGVKRTSWGRSQPRWSPCSQRQPGHPWPWCPVSRDASGKAWRVSFSCRDTLAIFRDDEMNLVREPLSAARAAPRRGQDAAERAAIDSRRVRSTIAPRRRGSARAARVARASGARPAWKIAHRSRRVHTYALGAGRVGHDDGLRALGADVDAGLDLHAGEGGGGGHKSSHCVGSGGVRNGGLRVQEWRSSRDARH